MSSPESKSPPPAATGDEPQTDGHLAKAAGANVSAEPELHNPPEYGPTPAARRRSALALLARRLFERRHP